MLRQITSPVPLILTQHGLAVLQFTFAYKNDINKPLHSIIIQLLI